LDVLACKVHPHRGSGSVARHTPGVTMQVHILLIQRHCQSLEKLRSLLDVTMPKLVERTEGTCNAPFGIDPAQPAPDK
jgi:hypothetical protein